MYPIVTASSITSAPDAHETIGGMQNILTFDWVKFSYIVALILLIYWDADTCPATRSGFYLEDSLKGKATKPFPFCFFFFFFFIFIYFFFFALL